MPKEKITKSNKKLKNKKITKTAKKADNKTFEKNIKKETKSVNQKFYDQLKLNESYVSLILGSIVVIGVFAIIFAYMLQTREDVKTQRILNSVVTPTPEPSTDTYIMQEGESLWDIAVRFYGDGFEYVRIVEANKDAISNPDFVPPGTEIVIPNL